MLATVAKKSHAAITKTHKRPKFELGIPPRKLEDLHVVSVTPVTTAQAQFGYHSDSSSTSSSLQTITNHHNHNNDNSTTRMHTRSPPLPYHQQSAVSGRLSPHEERFTASEVAPNLLVGSALDAADAAVLLARNVLFVLNVAAECDFSASVRSCSLIECLHLPLHDTATENIRRVFPTACHFIERALASGAKILVHCFMGLSRAPTVVLSFLVRRALLERQQHAVAISIAVRFPSHQQRGGQTAQDATSGDFVLQHPQQQQQLQQEQQQHKGTAMMQCEAQEQHHHQSSPPLVLERKIAGAPLATSDDHGAHVYQCDDACSSFSGVASTQAVTSMGCREGTLGSSEGLPLPDAACGAPFSYCGSPASTLCDGRSIGMPRSPIMQTAGDAADEDDSMPPQERTLYTWLAAIQNLRPNVLPNVGFMAALADWSTEIAAAIEPASDAGRYLPSPALSPSLAAVPIATLVA